jgi:thioredoxin 1
MKYLIITVLLVTTGMYVLWPGTKELEPQEFAEALEHTPNAVLIDVRSSRDFSKGHISGATNIDTGWPTYKWRVAELDTTLHVFLYCQDGGRSTGAAAYMRSKGFVSVTVLKGGLKRWLGEGYALTPEELIAPLELTFGDFSRMLDLEHLVIVDFYLPGDRNCRKIEPVLDEISSDYHGKIKILRIDIDRYKHLATEMGIESVPTLQFYENGNLCATIEGVNGRDRIEGEFRLREYVVMAYRATCSVLPEHLNN